MSNNKTYMQPKESVKRKWHLFDVKDQVLGRVCTQIATKLIGKQKPTFTPHTDGGDYVVVINAKEVVVTRNKSQSKIYYRHTGFPGGLKQQTFAELLEDNPEKIIMKAVNNMLPKNKLRQTRMARLKIFAGDQHPHENHFAKKNKQVEGK